MKKRCALLVFLLIFGCVGCSTQSGNNTGENDKIYAISSDMEAVFDRLCSLIVNSLQWKIMGDDKDMLYEVHGDTTQSIDRVSVDINVTKDEQEFYHTTYTIYMDEKEVYSFTVENLAHYSLDVYFKDITQDGKEDLAISVQQNEGNCSDPYLTYIYDIENNKEINIFDEIGSFTEEQTKVLEEKIGDQLITLFPNAKLSTVRGWGEIEVDCNGNLYYHTLFAEKHDPIRAVGELLVMFDYDKENETFVISNVMCGWPSPVYLEKLQEETSESE